MITKREFLCSAVLTVAAFATARFVPALAQSDSPAKKGGAVTPAEARAIDNEAYIWGSVLVDDQRIQYPYFIGRTAIVHGARHSEVAKKQNSMIENEVKSGRIGIDNRCAFSEGDYSTRPCL
jgi:hypothetical protein